METQHGDHLMFWWSLAGGIALTAVVCLFVVLGLLERRRERIRLAEADAILLPAASTVAQRRVEEIALDGATAEEIAEAVAAKADSTRDARLKAWLAFDERAWLRAKTVETQAAMIGVERRSRIRASMRAARIAEKHLGYADRLVGLHADLLIEECNNDRSELVDLVNTTCAWPPEWELELAELLTGERVPA